MQSSTGQYSTHAGDPAQPVQHSVMTASSFGFFFRGVAMPFERGSCFSSIGTGCALLRTAGSAAIEIRQILWLLYRSAGIRAARACRVEPDDSRLVAAKHPLPGAAHHEWRGIQRVPYGR